MAGVNEIRSTFLDYFRKNGHEVVPSSPLVPRNDPTLMFTNAGMVQFKNVFTGLEHRSYNRATTSQKCVRAGGKHNDLDNVGYTARHHTFFEMLGNFSFGDYFKDEAISFAWNLITKEFGLPKDKLLVTVYHTDDDAANYWKKIAGLSDDRIIRIATSDNFWAMGDTGPCGPCSEIFFDHGDHIWGGPPGSADEDGDRFIEIWNLVFMQFEQITPEQRIDLPRPSIDTGMGLERVAAVLQGVHDNYDIDLFKALIRASEEATGVKADGEFRASHRVIADHLRASSFLIADGVLPAKVPYATPAVRVFARELGVDLLQISGTEKGGRITKGDVQKFVKAALSGGVPAAAGAAVAAGGGLNLLPWPKVDFSKFGETEVQPLSRIKKISGANLARNWAMIPHVTQFEQADITDLEGLRVALNKENEKAGIKLTMLAFLIKASAAALKKFPEFNASLDASGENLTLKKYFHIGFAADTPNGLVVPVIRDVDKKGVVQIAQETTELAKKARDGKLGPADMSGGCFSISSLGGIGGTAFTPIVNAPEVAILGVSKSAIQPVWNGKEFAPKLMLPLSLSYDHRVIDGALAARFTTYLSQVLADMRRVLL